MIKKSLIIVVVISVLLLSSAAPVYQAKALDGGGSWAMAISYNLKEYGFDTVARVIARSLFQKTVVGIINKIQTGGRTGGPAFVQNWRNFQTNAQYRGEDVFRAILANTETCGYLGGGIKNIFGANRRLPLTGQNIRVGNFDPFTLRAKCTLPTGWDPVKYRQNFAANGGWEAWSRLLEPQNNYYGLLFMSLDEANRQRAVEESSDIYEATSGGGYTSIRGACQDQVVPGGGPTQPASARCTFLGEVFTPADLLGKSAASTIDRELGWLTSSDELSEVIIDITLALANRLTNLGSAKTRSDYASSPKVTQDTTTPRSIDQACANYCESSFNQDPTELDACLLDCEAIGPPGGSNGGGGGGVCTTCTCRGTGTADYTGDVRRAVNEVISDDPILAGLPNLARSSAGGVNARGDFQSAVVSKLESFGFRAISNALNGNDRPNTSFDLVALWQQSNDTTMERYDILASFNKKPTIGEAGQWLYTGDIPFVCYTGNL